MSDEGNPDILTTDDRDQRDISTMNDIRDQPATSSTEDGIDQPTTPTLDDRDKPNISTTNDRDKSNISAIDSPIDDRDEPNIEDRDKPNISTIDDRDKPNISTVDDRDKPNFDDRDKSNISTFDGRDKPNISTIDDGDKPNLSTVDDRDKPNFDDRDKSNISTFGDRDKQNMDDSNKPNISTIDDRDKPNLSTMNDSGQREPSNLNLKQHPDLDVQDHSTPESESLQTKRNLSERIFGWIQGISVEPVLFLQNISSQVVWIASQDLMMDKACKVNLNFDDNVCANLNEHKDRQKMVQDLVSEFMMWRSIFETGINVIFTLFLGAWGDRWGRKRPLILCLTGMMLEAVIHLINSQISSGRIETMLISSVPFSLGGGYMALLMLCFAHMADSSESQQRTLRMGFLDSAYYLGMPVGNAIVGPLLDAGGYVGAFGLAIAIYVVTIIYVIIKISPIKPRESKQVEAKSICDVTQITDAIVVTVKPRPNRATLHILLLIMAMMFDSLPMTGESSFRYLYTKLALGWSHTDYSHWSTFASVLSSLTMIVVIPALSVGLRMPDGWMGFVGAVSRTASNFLYGLVNTPADEWLIWTGAVVASLKNMAPVAIRSMLSKIAGPQDVGKVYAVMATVESLIEFASAPMYRAVYTATNSTRPGAYNFLSAGLNTILTITLLGVTLSLRSIKRRTSTEESNLTENEDTGQH